MRPFRPHIRREPEDQFAFDRMFMWLVRQMERWDWSKDETYYHFVMHLYSHYNYKQPNAAISEPLAHAAGRLHKHTFRSDTPYSEGGFTPRIVGGRDFKPKAKKRQKMRRKMRRTSPLPSDPNDGGPRAA